MVFSLITLRLEIADDVQDVKFLKYYSVWDKKGKVRNKTYASVAGRSTSESDKSVEVSVEEKTEEYRPSELEKEGCSKDFSETLDEELNKTCQGQRDFSDIHIEYICDKDITNLAMEKDKSISDSSSAKEKNPKDSKDESVPSSKQKARSRQKEMKDNKGERTTDSNSKQKTHPRQRDTKSEPDERPSGSQPESSETSHQNMSSTSMPSSRPKSHSPTAKMPNTISFNSGNPNVELTKGILHIYTDTHMNASDKDSSSTERSEMLCMLGVPASHTIHDLINFVSPMGDYVAYMQVLRDAFPNQYMLLIKFRDQATADEFYSYFNNRPFNSLESDVCHLVFVGKVETVRESEGGSLPLMDLTELPNCPVCLERMEGSEDGKGILTVLCNHSFHMHCLAQWGDTSCPVCRYCQTPEGCTDQRCMQCGSQESLWMCLICGNIGCGRYVGLHSYKHFTDTNHTYAMQLGTNRVWDYAGDNYVHRLAQNKSDGKLVAVDEGGNEIVEEKLDSITLEYTYLLTSQLESQRLYFMEQIALARQDAEAKLEECKQRLEKEARDKKEAEARLNDVAKEKQTLEKKFNQLHSRTGKMLNELQDEKRMNKCLAENQQQLVGQVTDLETHLKHKDKEMCELDEQLRDVMFYLEAQQKLANTTDVSQAEIQASQVFVSPAPSYSQSQGASSSGGEKKGRKKKAR